MLTDKGGYKAIPFLMIAEKGFCNAKVVKKMYWVNT